MDADRFEGLLRSFAERRPRRSLARLLGGLSLGGVLAALGITDAVAGSRIGGKPCTKNFCAHGQCTHPRMPNGTACGVGKVCHQGTCCTPNCTGKTCGGDGCGGSCGTCSFGSCVGGTCTCPSEKERCGNTCVATCGPGEARNPTNCACCRTHRKPCRETDPYEGCCSGFCSVDDGWCVSKPDGAPCDFDAQCISGDCFLGSCSPGQGGG